MLIALSVVTHLVAAAGGAYVWPHLQTLYASFKASRAVKNAASLLAAEQARVAALEAAAKVVAAQPKPATPAVPTPPTGA